MNRIAFCVLIGLGLAASAGCRGASQRAFPSPDAAVEALVSALREDNTKELEAIFGEAGDDILSSGDAVADRNDHERFLQAYDAKHELAAATTTGADEMMLTIGQDDWPFPVPLVHEKKGWVFDTARGMDEILNRRIGRNELQTIEVCLAVVDAQREYARLDPAGVGLPVYARRVISTAGKKDGLYWATAEGEPPSPLGPLVARAADEGYSGPRAGQSEPLPYYGYRYRLLTAQGPHARDGARDYVIDGQLLGGFALLAYPADYGNSGVMSFITNQDGNVFQRDLGPETERLARAINSYDPDDRWKPAPTTQPATQAVSP